MSGPRTDGGSLEISKKDEEDCAMQCFRFTLTVETR
jgi:hypothetical protein